MAKNKKFSRNLKNKKVSRKRKSKKFSRNFEITIKEHEFQVHEDRGTYSFLYKGRRLEVGQDTLDLSQVTFTKQNLYAKRG